jgi:glycosyltransferase involved in cell wall biosynthesis
MKIKVTISTITANRRSFFPHTIRNVLQQDREQFDIEWVIVEDGDESVQDLISHLDFVTYKRLDGKNSVGEKRNIANSMSSGDFILFLDDDNYAFPHRLRTSVNSLMESNLPMAGSSDMLILDAANWEVFQVGPFSEMHATLGTWCIRREILDRTQFNPADFKGEEVSFTKNWTIPILQLGALNSSISFSHKNNTVPKDNLKSSWAASWLPSTFINCPETLHFYKSISGRI